MRVVARNLGLPAILGLVFMLPFLLLEWINRRSFPEPFPFPLFAILWFLPAVFFVVLIPVVRNVQAGNEILARPVRLFLMVAFLTVIAWLWGSIMMDQLPCFFGVPNCD